MSDEQEIIDELQEYLDVGDNDRIALYIEEVQMCIEALEKQIAKKLVVWDNGTQHCPNCEHDLTYISSEDEYCCRCGTKIDWSE